MKGRYRPFTRHGLPSARQPKITFQSGGTVSFNPASFVGLHRPRLIRPFYDEEHHVIRIQAARVENAHTIRVRNDGGTYVFAGAAFLHQFGIDTTTARQYDVVVEAGRLFIDLKQTPKLVSKRKKAAGTAEVPAEPLPEEQPLEASESSALAQEQPPALPKLEGLMQALLPIVEW